MSSLLLNKYINNQNSNNSLAEDSSLSWTILMYYQSTLRNIGIFTSISIALFTFTSFFAGNYLYKDARYMKIIVRLLAFLVLLISIYIAGHLFIDIQNLKKYIDVKKNSNIINIDSWQFLIIFIIIFLVILFGIYLFVVRHHFNLSRFK
tara:strand:- start:201 stop:647 length:447 start_codon:yes stop_codon:yes gene_type:complete